MRTSMLVSDTRRSSTVVAVVGSLIVALFIVLSLILAMSHADTRDDRHELHQFDGAVQVAVIAFPTRV